MHISWRHGELLWNQKEFWGSEGSHLECISQPRDVMAGCHETTVQGILR